MGKVVIKKNWLATLTEMKMGDANMTHSNWSFSPLLRGKSVLGWAAPGVWDSERVPGYKGEPSLEECGDGGSLSLVAIWTITEGTRQLWRVFGVNTRSRSREGTCSHTMKHLYSMNTYSYAKGGCDGVMRKRGRTGRQRRWLCLPGGRHPRGKSTKAVSLSHGEWVGAARTQQMTGER